MAVLDASVGLFVGEELNNPGRFVDLCSSLRVAPGGVMALALYVDRVHHLQIPCPSGCQYL